MHPVVFQKTWPWVGTEGSATLQMTQSHMGDDSVAFVTGFVGDRGTKLWELGQTLGGHGLWQGGLPCCWSARQTQSGEWEGVTVEGVWGQGRERVQQS